MKMYFFVKYSYHKDLDETSLRELTKRFGETGVAPGTIAHYVNLDGSGGFTITEAQSDGDRAKAFETTITYGPWMDFEIVPVTTMDDALPSILKLYG